MEDTLRGNRQLYDRKNKAVLILVLMEDTLRERRGNETVTVSSVLILVLMEDTLRDKKKFGSKIQKPS